MLLAYSNPYKAFNLRLKTQALRGSSWKGKDCDDLSKRVHPGAVPIAGDRVQDTNCNGIYVAIQFLSLAICVILHWHFLFIRTGKHSRFIGANI